MISSTDEFKQFANCVWGQLKFDFSAQSIAVLDRTTLMHSSALFRDDFFKSVNSSNRLSFGGKLEPNQHPSKGYFLTDPFVAFSDLSTVVCAAIFYDRIIVAHPNPKISDEFRLLGIDQYACRVDPGDRSSSDYCESAIGNFIQDLWAVAYAKISNDWTSRRFKGEDSISWINNLESHWKDLIPNIEHIKLDSDQCDYTSSPNQQTWPIHYEDNGTWTTMPQEDLLGLVRDNTYRGYFYILLSEHLSELLKFSEFDTEVAYIGSCLRTPMQLSYLEGQISPSTPVERFLDDQAPRILTEEKLHMPFWFDSVMSQCDSKKDFPNALNRMRTMAEPFRKRRFELGSAIRDGNVKEARKLQEAMTNSLIDIRREISSLAPDLAVSTVTKLVESASPINLAVSGISLFKEPILRTFERARRPHIASVVSLVDAASSCTNSLSRATDVFNLPNQFVEQPTAFLRNLGKVKWVI